MTPTNYIFVFAAYGRGYWTHEKTPGIIRRRFLRWHIPTQTEHVAVANFENTRAYFTSLIHWTEATPDVWRYKHI